MITKISKKLNIINSNLFSLKIFCIILFIISIFALIMSTYEGLKEEKNIFFIIIYNFSLFLFPLLLGYYANTYLKQKEAITELSKNIKSRWEKSIILENKYYQGDVIHEKETLFCTLMYYYFINIKWFKNQLFNLPENIKNKIDEYCDPIMQGEYMNEMIFEPDEEYLIRDPLAVKLSNVHIKKLFRQILIEIEVNNNKTIEIIQEFNIN